MKTHKNFIIAVAITLVIAGGGGFYGGMVFGKSRSPARVNFSQMGANANRPGGVAANRLRQGTGFINGDILSKDDKSITVKNRDGGSQIVFLAPSTAIVKTTDGTASDLTVGENVMVNGTPNSDGTVTATNIQIRPAGSVPFVGGPNGAVK